MLIRNRQRPPAQRDWPEVEAQLDELAKAAPNSVEPIVLRAMLYAEQDQQAKAWETLEAARSKFPEALEPWTAEAELLVRQKKFDEALGRLDSAQKQLGDRIELRLARATIWVGRGAPTEEVVKVLNGLAKDLEPSRRTKRRGLLAYLAGELAVRQDVKGAEEIWLRLAEEDPEDVNPHLQLFDLALKAAVKAETDKQAEAEAQGEDRHRDADQGDREDRRNVWPLLPSPIPDVAGGPLQGRQGRRPEEEAADRSARPVGRAEGTPRRVGPDPPGRGRPGGAGAGARWGPTRP